MTYVLNRSKAHYRIGSINNSSGPVMNHNAILIEQIRAGAFDFQQQLINLRSNAIRLGNEEVLDAVNKRLKKKFPVIYRREVGPLIQRYRDKRFHCYCNQPKSEFQVHQDILNEIVPDDALQCEDCWGNEIKRAWGYYGYSKKKISVETWKKLCDLRMKVKNGARSVSPIGLGGMDDKKGTVHCPDCVEGKACGHFHVYVIELRKEVLDKEKGFPFEEALDTDKKVYYVGQTLHRVECRYEQHVAARNKKPGEGIYCNCFTPEKKFRAFKKFNKPGKYVNKYHQKEGLRPDLYFGKNPAVRTDAKTYKGMMKDLQKRAEEEEKKLADTLRSQGHAVHYN